jgi:hypothetical protein
MQQTASILVHLAAPLGLTNGDMFLALTVWAEQRGELSVEYD